MVKLNKKQIIIIILILISIYTIIQYMKGNDKASINENELIEYKQEDEILSQEITKEKIKIYITGAIKNEGVYELEENSRIADVIEVAGGINENADLDKINLAYKLEDGIKIYIPVKGEKIEEKEQTNEFISKEEEAYSNSNTSKENINTSKININTATQLELETLPGIGNSTAQKIIKYRKENGKFSKIEDIKKVNGIGDSKFNNIKDLIKV